MVRYTSCKTAKPTPSRDKSYNLANKKNRTALAHVRFFLYLCRQFIMVDSMRKFILIVIALIGINAISIAATIVHIADPETWTYSELRQYVGQTVQFDAPFYVCNNYSGLTISPRRTYSPTNQALPLSDNYYSILSLNSTGNITLNNVSGYHRLGERLHNLTVKVNSTNNVSFVSCNWQGNTRADMEKGPDYDAIDMRGQHTLLVCCMNLEYYLVENLGGDMGASNYSEHQKQRAKVSKALAKINADLYGFVEIEQGQTALAEIASDLSRNTGRKFSYVDDGGSASGTYTKSGFVYCSDMLQPYGKLRENNTGVKERKKTQAFQEISTGEKFLFSVNHFKAKSGRGSGDNADKGDGQSTYNGDRVREATAVVTFAKSCATYFGDEDVLVMGDLNAYSMEDPIRIFTDAGYANLIKKFEGDEGYSYSYRGSVGCLDHALANKAIECQVTGCEVFHINADEASVFGYDGYSYQNNMYRSSDHDPVVVGLKLNISTPTESINMNDNRIVYGVNGIIGIAAAEDYKIDIYSITGQLIYTDKINTNDFTISTSEHNLKNGIYIIKLSNENNSIVEKLEIKK